MSPDGLPIPSATTQATSAKGSPILAAYYFGTAGPYNFWNSDLSGAPQAFRQIKADGFNAVALAIPWGDFEPTVAPPTFNTGDFERLDHLIELADQTGLDVVLRLSYGSDVYPGDQLAWGERTLEVFGRSSVYMAWLDYISALHQNVEGFHNIVAAEISWEDFWAPVWTAQGLSTLHRRLALAKEIGYSRWLQANYSLEQVGAYYGTSFQAWADVPTPSYHQPAFALIYQFIDSTLINRFFLPAQARFPGLTLEARVDADPYYDGNTAVGSYSHSSTWQLPGTSVTGIYFSPYMGDPSSSHDETVADALQGLQSTLQDVASQSGGRDLVIYEYEFASNAGVVSSAPSLAPSELSAFIEGSAPYLAQYTDGYALWTYHDFNMSPVYNPSFALGTAGWTVSGATRSSDGSSPTFVAMSPGASVAQTIPPVRLKASRTTPVTLSFRTWAPRTGRLRVELGSAPGRVVTVARGWHTTSLTYSASQLGDGRLQLDAHSALHLTDVELYDFTQLGYVYSTSGTPETALSGIRSLNQQLAG